MSSESTSTISSRWLWLAEYESTKWDRGDLKELMQLKWLTAALETNLRHSQNWEDIQAAKYIMLSFCGHSRTLCCPSYSSSIPLQFLHCSGQKLSTWKWAILSKSKLRHQIDESKAAGAFFLLFLVLSLWHKHLPSSSSGTNIHWISANRSRITRQAIPIPLNVAAGPVMRFFFSYIENLLT